MHICMRVSSPLELELQTCSCWELNPGPLNWPNHLFLPGLVNSNREWVSPRLFALLSAQLPSSLFLKHGHAVNLLLQMHQVLKRPNQSCSPKPVSSTLLIFDRLWLSTEIFLFQGSLSWARSLPWDDTAAPRPLSPETLWAPRARTRFSRPPTAVPRVCSRLHFQLPQQFLVHSRWLGKCSG